MVICQYNCQITTKQEYALAILTLNSLAFVQEKNDRCKIDNINISCINSLGITTFCQDMQKLFICLEVCHSPQNITH